MSHFVALPVLNMTALNAIHISPTPIIQAVINFRNLPIGTSNFSRAKIIIGTKKVTVLIVMAEKMANPCRFLSIFLNKQNGPCGECPTF